MATMTLNIYSKTNKNEVEKTYTAESYDLMLGTVEDIMDVIDIEKMTDNIEMTKMLVKGYRQLMPFLKDVFPEITDEDLKYVKVKELIPVFGQIIKTIIEDLNILNSGN